MAEQRISLAEQVKASSDDDLQKKLEAAEKVFTLSRDALREGNLDDRQRRHINVLLTSMIVEHEAMCW